MLYTIFSASRKGGGYEPSSSTLGPRLCFTLTNASLRGLHSRRRTVSTPFPPRIKILYQTATIPALSETGGRTDDSFFSVYFSDGVLRAHVLRSPACEGGHGTEFEKAGVREDDKATDLCLHEGRSFSSDRTATAVNCQKAVQTCLTINA